ncbi:hypothetical protein HNY73_021155 [Argiope bruennichi]|uniref:Uncharacterized protein n=1 Tax=Argiope bruennichi TaxID=94029 RepID=A0A8T0E986_ARGBR|nr:hypothetical protein HNY73_021155 [Argiope bruennichi]
MLHTIASPYSIGWIISYFLTEHLKIPFESAEDLITRITVAAARVRNLTFLSVHVSHSIGTMNHASLLVNAILSSSCIQGKYRPNSVQSDSSWRAHKKCPEKCTCTTHSFRKTTENKARLLEIMDSSESPHSPSPAPLVKQVGRFPNCPFNANNCPEEALAKRSDLLTKHRSCGRTGK